MFSHMPYAECIEEFFKGRSFGLLYGGKKVSGRSLRHPFEVEKILLLEEVDIGRVSYQLRIHQLCYQFIAESLYVHAAARGKVCDVLLDLSRTDQSYAAVRGLALKAHNVRAALRAGGWHDKFLFLAAPLRFDDLYDLRDDVSRPLDDNGVAYANVLLFDLIHVVERRPAHCDACDFDGFHDGDGSEYACASHMHADIFDDGLFLCRGEFTRNGPTRTSGYCAQPLLDFNFVYLDHDPIDFIWQLLPDLIDVVIVCDALMDIPGLFYMGVDPEAPVAKGLQDIPVSFKCFSGNHADAVTEDLQGSSRGYPGIQLPQRAGGRIPGIGKGLLAFL